MSVMKRTSARASPLLLLALIAFLAPDVTAARYAVTFGTTGQSISAGFEVTFQNQCTLATFVLTALSFVLCGRPVRWLQTQLYIIHA